jgi:hypothetical protein
MSEYNKWKRVCKVKAIVPKNSINKQIFVTEECCVFSEAVAEFLNIISTSFGFKGLNILPKIETCYLLHEDLVGKSKWWRPVERSRRGR